MTLIKKNLKGGWETVCAYAWRRGFTKFTRCNMGMGGNKENSCECTWMGPYMYNGSLNCIWHCNTSYKSVVWHLKKAYEMLCIPATITASSFLELRISMRTVMLCAVNTTGSESTITRANTTTYQRRDIIMSSP